MFTGLIDDVGVVERVEQTDAGRELRVACRVRRLADGESIAVNGACLTVREHGAGWFTVAAVVTTLDRTTIGDWDVGRRVNLERALRLGDRLGRAFRAGPRRRRRRRSSASSARTMRCWSTLLCRRARRLMVPHGSVTVDGVSLTVNDLPAPGILQLSLIEYTCAHTTLGALRPATRVHVEADMIGKYVRQLVAPYAAAQVSRHPLASDTRDTMPFSTIEQAIADIRAGKFVIVADDEDRENEGDLICAAQLVTPEMINFMIKKAGGMICLALTGERVDQLGLAADGRDATPTSTAPRTRSASTRRRASA